MNYGKIRDLWLCLWHCLLKAATFENQELRYESARITETRLKSLRRQYQQPAPLVKEEQEGALPQVHQFQEVLGVSLPEALENQSEISHISQYRLAVYLSSLSEMQRAREMNDFGQQRCA